MRRARLPRSKPFMIATHASCARPFRALRREKPAGRYRAFYPQISLETTSFGMVDSRLSYGHVVSPGRYAATITRPSLFRAYLTTQFELLLRITAHR
jgi:AMP nucleosidase